jgi:hypothetical protein
LLPLSHREALYGCVGVEMKSERLGRFSETETKGFFS